MGKENQLAADVPPQGPNPFDQTLSFNESDVSTTTSSTRAASGGVELYEGDTAGDLKTAFDPTNTDTESVDSGSTSGVRFTADVYSVGLEAVIGNSTSGFTTAVLYNRDLGQTAAQMDVSGLSSGDRLRIVSEIQAGTSYDLYLKNDNSGWSSNRFSPAGGEFPVSDEYFTLTAGLGNFGSNTSYVYAFPKIASIRPAKAGEATIEWERGVPEDIFEWELATFTQSPDGETVNVYVAYSGDGGATWTRSNGGSPINRNYSLIDDPNISSSDDVRIEVELSRNNTDNNPTLDSAYRSWFL